MSTDTSSAVDQPTMSGATPKHPRDKVMRLATMTKQLLDEVRTQPLDTAGLDRLRTIDTQIIGELLTDLSPDLRQELQRLALPITRHTELSDAELRIAHAQLVGWLQGLLQTTQTALADPHAVLAHDSLTVQAATDTSTSSDIPDSVGTRVSAYSGSPDLRGEPGKQTPVAVFNPRAGMGFCDAMTIPAPPRAIAATAALPSVLAGSGSRRRSRRGRSGGRRIRGWCRTGRWGLTRPPPALAQDRYRGLARSSSSTAVRCSTGGLTSWNGWIATLFNAPVIQDSSDERRRRPAAQPSVTSSTQPCRQQSGAQHRRLHEWPNVPTWPRRFRFVPVVQKKHMVAPHL